MFGHLALDTQFRVLGIVFLASVLLTTALMYVYSQNRNRSAAYVMAASHLRPLVQMFPQATQNALRGDASGFQSLSETRVAMHAVLTSLTRGGGSRAYRWRQRVARWRAPWPACSNFGMRMTRT